jgi:hypothetical protein
LEFHIPFYALRRGPHTLDERSIQGKPLRSSQKLPLARNFAEKQDFYHEGHLSLLVTGVDEWLWTAYCCVDTYFGSECNWEGYLDKYQYGYDAPMGGGGPSAWIKHPNWNPREYFLLVLAQRMKQAVAEWSALINAFEERLVSYVC